MKKKSETRLKRIDTSNRLKRFKTKNFKKSSTKQTECYKILNIIFENSVDAIKKSNIVNKDIRVNNEIRDEIVRNIIESSNADDQIFENIIRNNNLSNSKIRNIHTTVKSNIRCSN